MVIKQLSAEARQILAQRALANGRSPQAEALAILEEVLHPAGPVQLGSALSELSKQSGLRNADVDALTAARAANPTPPMWFG